MNEYDIAVIAGDGIGPDVTNEALKVLDAAEDVYGFKTRRTAYPFGTDHFLTTGEIFPDAAFEEVKQKDAIYLGAIGDPRAPVGKIEFGIIAKLRFELDLYVNLRPVRLYDERLCPLKGKGPDDVDMLFIRENTEGAYAGSYGYTHKGLPHEVATQVMVFSRPTIEKTIRYAFEQAKTRTRRGDRPRTVTLIDKANALRAQDLWTRVFDDISKEYPDIGTEHAYIDAACMWMIKNPEWFDVAVCPNLFGDIITDLGAMVQGGMGLAASGNLHPGQVSLFEPIHGSAPKYAGKNVACPVAAILAVGMMLDYLGQTQAALTIENIVIDLLRSKRLKGVSTGDHPTNEVGDMIAQELRTATAKV
jgi:3-isopropylmalate dehydrogenase